jgi:hypothetical protein
VRYHNGVFRRYGKQQGVPDATINGLTADSRGGVWVLVSGHILAWDEASDRFTDIAPGSPAISYHPLLWDSTGFWVRQGDNVRVFTKGRFFDYALPKQFLKETIWGALLIRVGPFGLRPSTESRPGSRRIMQATRSTPTARRI